MMYMLCLLGLFIPIAVVQLRWAYRRHQMLQGGWHSVLTGVEKVNIEGIRAIAVCYLQTDSYSTHLSPEVMWQIVDGYDGLTRLKRNATAMLNLAVFSERWDRTETAGVSEQIRLDAVRLNRAISQIRMRLFFGMKVARFSLHLQEAVASYYLLRSRLIGQYEAVHGELTPTFEAAL